MLFCTLEKELEVVVRSSHANRRKRNGFWHRQFKSIKPKCRQSNLTSEESFFICLYVSFVVSSSVIVFSFCLKDLLQLVQKQIFWFNFHPDHVGPTFPQQKVQVRASKSCTLIWRSPTIYFKLCFRFIRFGSVFRISSWRWWAIRWEFTLLPSFWLF